MSWELASLIIGCVVGILAILGGIAKAIKSIWDVAAEVQQIKHQVKNSHDSNLRDDLDGKHQQILDGFERMDRRIDTLAEENKRQWAAIKGLDRRGKNRW